MTSETSYESLEKQAEKGQWKWKCDQTKRLFWLFCAVTEGRKKPKNDLIQYGVETQAAQAQYVNLYLYLLNTTYDL